MSDREPLLTVPLDKAWSQAAEISGGKHRWATHAPEMGSGSGGGDIGEPGPPAHITPALHKMMAQVGGQHVASMFADDGQIVPVVFLQDHEGKMGIVQIPPMRDANDKEMIAQGMRQVLKQANAKHYVFMYEAYLATAKPDISEAEKQAIMGQSLKNRPGRKEVVLLQGEDENGQHMAYREIVRDSPITKKPFLGPLKWMPSAQYSEGRFLGWLPQRGTNNNA